MIVLIHLVVNKELSRLVVLLMVVLLMVVVDLLMMKQNDLPPEPKGLSRSLFLLLQLILYH